MRRHVKPKFLPLMNFKLLAYYGLLPFIYLVALFPFWWLYRLSDILYFLLFRIIGYRKKVVLNNLKNAFPEKSQQERMQICKAFYAYLCDLFLESIKLLTISETQLRERVLFEDKIAFEKYKKKGQSVIVVMGHWGNWEWGGARFALEDLHQLYAIYHPLSNSYFDKLVKGMRTRFGLKLYTMRNVRRGMEKHKDTLTATAFIADQTPSPRKAYWTTYLNQETPVFTGAERCAKSLDFPIVFVGVRRLKRGYYKIEPEDLVDHPREAKEYEISELFTRRLEKSILEQPESWLWSHRRWKHKRETE